MRAILLVDVINHMEFPGGDLLEEQAAPIAARIVKLRAAAHRAGVPVIYANDNFGNWRWTSRDIVKFCMKRTQRGAKFTRAVAPTGRDYFVLKAKNSAFYCTSLEPLLESLKVKQLTIAGLTADNCVLFTAHDAYLREFKVHVPSDCVASQKAESTKRALEQLSGAVKASTRASTTLHLA
jgi:nicotinamidase-related amidase